MGPFFQFTHTTYLDAPAVVPLSRWADLEAAMFRNLRSMGLGASSMRIEGPSYQPQDLTLVCYLRDAALRIKIQSVEFWTASEEIATSPDVLVAMEGALSALVELDESLTVSTTVEDIWLHGDIPVACDELLGRFVTSAPEASVALRRAGVTFGARLPPNDEGGKALVTLEPSYTLLDPTTVFLRLRSEFPRTINPKQAQATAGALFREILGRFEIRRRG